MNDAKQDIRGRLDEVEEELKRIRKLYDQTIRYKLDDPETSLMHARKAAEAVCRQLFVRGIGKNPGNLTLEGFIEKLGVAGALPKRILVPLRTIQGYGNFAAHEQDEDSQSTIITPDYIQPCLHALAVVVEWYFAESAKGKLLQHESSASLEDSGKFPLKTHSHTTASTSEAEGNPESLLSCSPAKDISASLGSTSVREFARKHALTPAHIIRVARDILKIEFRTPSALLAPGQLEALEEHFERARKAQPDRGRPSLKSLDLGDGIHVDLNLVSRGAFTMGSPPGEEGHNDDEIEHEVQISHSLYVGQHPVTQEQYESVMGSNPSYFQGKKLPVEMVSWFDCVSFCEILSTEFRATIRLPTEAEWEYVCRAGTQTAFHCGSSITTEEANFDGKFTYGGASPGQTRWSTTTVGSFAPNPWGLWDMHGNVWEWCSDWYGEYTGGEASDPQGPASGDIRILRGGSWFHGPADARSAQRDALDPGRRHSLYGFRIVMEI